MSCSLNEINLAWYEDPMHNVTNRLEFFTVNVCLPLPTVYGTAIAGYSEGVGATDNLNFLSLTAIINFSLSLLQ